MRDKIISFSQENQLFAKGDSIIAAVSGGADSAALLHFFVSIRELYNLNIYAAHLNHGVRGEEADRDERFVRQLCDSYDVELFSLRLDIPKLARQNGESVELCGRKERYRFFSQLAERLDAKVATAHNANDNVETVLLNIIRGSGVSGLRGIPAKRDNIIRPLLCVRREEIESYCSENSLSYVTDSTNLEDIYTRNKIRHSLIPLLRELNPSAEESVGRLSLIAGDVDAYLNDNAEKELKLCKKEYGYDCESLLSLAPAIRSYAIKRILEDAGADFEYRHIKLIEDAMKRGGAVTLSDSFSVRCSQGILRIVKKSVNTQSLSVSVYEALVRDDLPVILKKEKRENIHKKFFKDAIPCDIITVDTVLRYRREGDYFKRRPEGMTKKLKKLLNEMKIPAERRDCLPLIANGSDTLWIARVGSAFPVSEEYDNWITIEENPN